MNRPATWKACKLVAYDNGFDLVLGTDMAVQVMTQFADARVESESVLNDVEAYFAGLSDEDLNTVCKGDQKDHDDLNVPNYVSEYLLNAFEAEL